MRDKLGLYLQMMVQPQKNEFFYCLLKLEPKIIICHSFEERGLILLNFSNN